MGELVDLRVAISAVRARAFGLEPSHAFTSCRLTSPSCVVGLF
jgi:hypothetical protein